MWQFEIIHVQGGRKFSAKKSLKIYLHFRREEPEVCKNPKPPLGCMILNKSNEIHSRYKNLILNSRINDCFVTFTVDILTKTQKISNGYVSSLLR